ncbi:hypothetical protein RNJ44_02124 [Nakaseomyces bracarensis]|uniref:SET domain-containing protein n=1 Tax=Nakaseomyces bracarensis TaxID=273131 RepID=A0ABR4NMJ2_9SACH
MSITKAEDIEDILDFVRGSRGFFDQERCEVKLSDVGGVGVFAKEDITESRALLKLHKTAIFSASNSSIANLLLDEQIDGVLALNIAFIYETTVFKDTSHWYKYLKTIKIDTNNLPPCYWNHNLKAMLKGTTLDSLFCALEPQDEINEGFEIAVELARKWNKEFGLEIPKGFLDVNDNDDLEIEEKLKKFVAIAYAISSRGFEIDSYHETALVPIADLFNHHCESPHLQFRTLYDVCDKCGEFFGCAHNESEDEEESEDEDDMSSGTEVSDNEAHIDESSQSNKEKVNSLSLELVKELEILHEDTEQKGRIKDEELDDDECIEMRLMGEVKKGEEIFNTYGDLSNSLLIARYGFCVEKNPHDIVHLGPSIIQFIRKNKEHQDKIEWFKETGFQLLRQWIISEQEEDEDEEEGEEEEDDDEYDSDEAEAAQSLWLSEMSINYDAEPTQILIALCKLLALDNIEWKNFSEYPDDKKFTRLAKENTKDARSILKALITEKLRLLKKPKNSNKIDPIHKLKYEAASILVHNECRILEKCLENYK